MNSTDLYGRFREDVKDARRPYLWTDTEVWSYMDAAYRMFVRKIGGVADFDSDVTVLEAVVGVPTVDLDKSILRITRATRRSDGNPVDVINQTDLGKIRSVDYSQIKQLALDNRLGSVRYMMIGMKPNVARLIMVPEANETIDLMVYRLPLVHIVGEGQEFVDVEEDHHIYLMDWMKHLAYKKQDAETYDPKKSTACANDFETYCHQVKAEIERYKHKTRVVNYGGL